MKISNHTTGDLFTIFSLRCGNPNRHSGSMTAYSLLAGMASIFVLGSAFTLSTTSMAQTVVDRYTLSKPNGENAYNIITVIGADANRIADIDFSTFGTVSGTYSGVSVYQRTDGNLRIRNSALIDDVTYGIMADHNRVGNLVIDNESMITNVERRGIDAKHKGEGLLGIHLNESISAKERAVSAIHTGIGDVEISTDSLITGDKIGIFARHRGDGDLRISTENRGDGSGGSIASLRRGIVARHDGSRGDIDINISSAGSIASTEREGIFVEHNGAGNVNLDTRGQISGHDSGISIDHSGSDGFSLSDGIFVAVHPGSLVSATAGDAIRVRSVEDSVTIDLAGSLSTDGDDGKAIDITGARRVNLRLHPGFSLNGKEAIVSTHPQYIGSRTSHVVHLDSALGTGSTGVLDFDANKFSGFEDLRVATSSIWEVKGTVSEEEAFQSVIVHSGSTLRFSGVNFKMAQNAESPFSIDALALPSGFTGNPAGILEVAGSNHLRGHMANSGRLVFVQTDTDASLTIDGDYSGESTSHELVFNVDLAEQRANKLTVNGNIGYEQHSFFFHIPGIVSMNVLGATNAPSAIAPPEKEQTSPVLIEATGHALTDDFFGRQTVGNFYIYDIEHGIAGGAHTWRFKYTGNVPTAEMAPSMVQAFLELAPPLAPPGEERPGGLHFWDDARRYAGGTWAQQSNSSALLYTGVADSNRLRMEDSRVHFGFDLPSTSLAGGNVIVGASMWQGLLTSDVSLSNGQGIIGIKSHAAALTASWRSPVGFYADGRTHYVRFLSDVSADRLSLVQNNEGDGVSASAEAGYRFAAPIGKIDLYVAPQAQLVWTSVGFDNFVGRHGDLVSLEDGDLVTGRLGLAWDGEWHAIGGSGHVYGGVNLRTDLDGKTSVNVSGISLSSKQKGLSVDGRLGVSYEWDESHAIYGEAVALRRDDAGEIRASFGMRVGF